MDFILRKWRDEDIPSVQKYANNLKIAGNLRDAFPFPYTKEDARSFITSCIQGDESRQCLRAIDLSGEAIGSIGLFLGTDVYCKSAELGYWLAEPFWRNGIMSEAIRRICMYAFAHYDLVRIYAQPFAGNTASRRTLQKAGFQLEGVLRDSVYKNGRILDSALYALLRDT